MNPNRLKFNLNFEQEDFANETWQNLNLNDNCFYQNDLNSTLIKVSVDIFYILGGFLSFFGIFLNFLCYLVVKNSKIFNKTCYGFYLKCICITDLLKLVAEYQFRIFIMAFYTIVNSCFSTLNLSTCYTNPNQKANSFTNFTVEFIKFHHCNLRLGFIMITENLSYIYYICLAADRVCRIWNGTWTKRMLKLKFVKKMTLIVSICVLVYCHPHFYPVDQCHYLIYANGYLTGLVYSECMVLNNKMGNVLSFNIYWKYVESFVNSVFLPCILVSLNVILSVGIFWKGKGTFSISYTGACSRFSSKRNSVEPFPRLKRKNRLYRAAREASFVVLADTLVFILVITPVNAFTYYYKSTDQYSRNVKKAFSLVGLTVSLVNHSFNGIVYLICSKTFRDEFCKTLRYLIKNKTLKNYSFTSKSNIQNQNLENKPRIQWDKNDIIKNISDQSSNDRNNQINLKKSVQIKPLKDNFSIKEHI